MRCTALWLGLVAPLGAGCILVQDSPLGDAGFDAGGPTGCASPSGQLTVTPLDINFGFAVVHSMQTQFVSVTNCTLKGVVVTPSLGGPEASIFTAGRTAPFNLAAGGVVSFTVTYAPLAPSIQDSATLDLFFDSGGSATVTLEGTALASGLKITPNPLSFGFAVLPPGTPNTSSFTLTNIGNVTLTVTSASIANPGTPAAFSIASGSWIGGVLAPGDSRAVSVSFSPPQAGKYDGELDLSSTDNANILPVTLVGFGGGAAITCSPPTLDFGTVAANVGASLPVMCTNIGSDVPNHPEAGLILSTLTANNPSYSAEVDPQSMYQASATQPLAAGQSVQVDAKYLPVSPSTDVSVLTINSNVTDGTAKAPPTVSLSGMGHN